jgi:hypothetical protein
MSSNDELQRFVFEGAGVRGAVVHLDASWHAVLERHPYPPAVQRPLGQALAAAVLLSSTIKFEGALILQVQAEGPLRTLVVQATDQRTLRGLAHWDGDVRIIRPLVYARETQTAAFATEAGLPVVPDSCPACFGAPTQRLHMKQLLAAEERANPHLYANLLHAMRPLMGEQQQRPRRGVQGDDGSPHRRRGTEKPEEEHRQE